MRFQLNIDVEKKGTSVEINGSDDRIIAAMINAMNDCPELKELLWRAILIDTISDTPDRRVKKISVKK